MKQKVMNQLLPFIRKDNFRLLFPDIKDNSYDQNIKNWLKTKIIISLKRGLYIFSNYWDRCQDKGGYLNYLSSIIYYPSYVSKETVLSKYGILTESVYGISSVTSKTRRIFSAEIAIFDYSKIKDCLFTGFEVNYFNKNPYYIATKSKALFDFLYFYKRKLKFINLKTIDELRLNLENINGSDWLEFEKYLELAKSVKLNKIYKIIKKEYAF
jgi:hypothetical protein